MERTERRALSRIHAARRQPAAKPRTVKSLYVNVLFLGLILAGSAIGAIYASKNGMGNGIYSGTQMFMFDIISKDAASKGFGTLMISAFFPPAVLLCISFILGLSAVGVPFLVIPPVIQGAFIGVSMSVIDMRYGIKGLAICLLFILPQSILTAFAMITAGREGVRFSLKMSTHIFRSEKQQPLKEAFHLFCYKYVVCFIVIILAASLQALSVIFFSRIFFY